LRPPPDPPLDVAGVIKVLPVDQQNRKLPGGTDAPPKGSVASSVEMFLELCH
jgi:hypothetical protein